MNLVDFPTPHGVQVWFKYDMAARRIKQGRAVYLPCGTYSVPLYRLVRICLFEGYENHLFFSMDWLDSSILTACVNWARLDLVER
jgi:hypothetical protein